MKTLAVRQSTQTQKYNSGIRGLSIWLASCSFWETGKLYFLFVRFQCLNHLVDDSAVAWEWLSMLVFAQPDYVGDPIWEGFAFPIPAVVKHMDAGCADAAVDGQAGFGCHGST